MWTLILFGLLALIVCIMAFVRAASMVNNESHAPVDDAARLDRVSDRDAA